MHPSALGAVGLVDGKRPSYETAFDRRVARLYRYERFTETYLQDTLQGTIHFSKPSDFNDPWDCKPSFSIPVGIAERDELIQWFDRVARQRDPHPNEMLRARQIEELRASPAKLQSIIDETSRLIKADMDRRYRVYCLTTKPACPLMWAHYGDKHHGICLEFDATQKDLCAAIKVQYRETYPTFPLNDGEDISPFYTKSADWEYEDEYRLISEEEGTAFDKDTLKTRNGFCHISEDALKSVIVGSLAPPKVRAKIKEMVARIAPAVVVRQATCLPDRYQLRIDPPVPTAVLTAVD